MGEKYNGTQKKTKYGDFWYDSQLEAQWAVFYNDAVIRTVPHPATFRTGKCYQGREIVYTPDFYLPDYDVFCEVKATDNQINDCEFQRKVSAAMDQHITPIGNGLLILGPMNGFRSSDTKRCFLYGEFYQWHNNAICKSYWSIGRFGNVENKICFDDPILWSDSNYPRFAQNPSVTLFRSYDDVHASEIVYRSILNAIYAKDNNLFDFETNNSDSIKKATVPDDKVPEKEPEFINFSDSWSDDMPW